MIPDLVVATRLHIDDFHIFKIWYQYHKHLSPNFCCCIHLRAADPAFKMVEFCEVNKIKYVIHRAEVFDNKETLNALLSIVRQTPGKVVLHIDCDEFIDDFGQLNHLCERVIYNHEESFTCSMIDRVNEEQSLYDTSACNSYEELCALAPIRTMINQKFYIADYKCFLNRWPHLGFIHEPDAGMKSQHISNVSLDHFKWRTEWIGKAHRRVKEVKKMGLHWAKYLEKCIISYEQTGKV